MASEYYRNLNMVRDFLIDAQDMCIQNRPAQARWELTKALYIIRSYTGNNALFVTCCLIKNTIACQWHSIKVRSAVLDSLDGAIAIVEEQMGLRRRAA